MTQAPARAKAVIDLAALRHNYRRVGEFYPRVGVVPAIKADAYGHGVAAVAGALARCEVRPAGFGLATIEEALAVLRLRLGVAVVLWGGCADVAELALCWAEGIEPVLHSAWQVEALVRLLEAQGLGGERRRGVVEGQYWDEPLGVGIGGGLCRVAAVGAVGGAGGGVDVASGLC